MRHHLYKRYLRNNDGSMAIEAAITLPVFLVFILSIITLCHAAMVRQSMYYGIDVAGRQAMVSPSTANSDLETTALNRMNIDASKVTINATDSSSAGIDYKVFDASYTYTFPNLVGFGSVTMDVNVSVPLN